MAVVVDMLNLGVQDAALAIAVDLGALLTNPADSVGLVGVRADVKNRVGSVGRVGTGGAGARSSGVGTRVGSGEGSTSDKGSTNRENDAHGHGGCKNGSHAVGLWSALGRGNEGDQNYLVTMVLTASSLPVGVMMNQNKTLAMLTIQMDYCNGAN